MQVFFIFDNANAWLSSGREKSTEPAETRELHPRLLRLHRHNGSPAMPGRPVYWKPSCRMLDA